MKPGLRREMAGVRNAQLQLVREKARLEDLELAVSHNLSQAVRDVDFYYQTAQTHLNRLSAAENEIEILEAAKGEVQLSGRTPTDLLLEAQRRRAFAKAAYYQALCDYNKSLKQVHFRKGSLLEYNAIELAEGPWPKKAYFDALNQARRRAAAPYFDYGYTQPNVVSTGPVPVVDGNLHNMGVDSLAPIPTNLEPTPLGVPEWEEIPVPKPTPAATNRTEASWESPTAAIGLTPTTAVRPVIYRDEPVGTAVREPRPNSLREVSGGQQSLRPVTNRPSFDPWGEESSYNGDLKSPYGGD